MKIIHIHCTKIENMIRGSVTFTDETNEILKTLKKGGGLKRDRAVELSLLYANKNKEDFATFVGEETTSKLKNTEKKED